MSWLFEEVLKEKRERFERLRKETLQKFFSALDRLSDKVSFEDAFIFGSLVRPYRFTEHSDVDIAFCGLRDEDFFRVMALLSEELGRDVDVVQLEGHRLEKKIRRTGIRWRGQDTASSKQR